MPKCFSCRKRHWGSRFYHHLIEVCRGISPLFIKLEIQAQLDFDLLHDVTPNEYVISSLAVSSWRFLIKKIRVQQYMRSLPRSNVDLMSRFQISILLEDWIWNKTPNVLISACVSENGCRTHNASLVTRQDVSPNWGFHASGHLNSVKPCILLPTWRFQSRLQLHSVTVLKKCFWFQRCNGGGKRSRARHFDGGDESHSRRHSAASEESNSTVQRWLRSQKEGKQVLDYMVFQYHNKNLFF